MFLWALALLLAVAAATLVLLVASAALRRRLTARRLLFVAWRLCAGLGVAALQGLGFAMLGLALLDHPRATPPLGLGSMLVGGVFALLTCVWVVLAGSAPQLLKRVGAGVLPLVPLAALVLVAVDEATGARARPEGGPVPHPAGDLGALMVIASAALLGLGGLVFGLGLYASGALVERRRRWLASRQVPKEE